MQAASDMSTEMSVNHNKRVSPWGELQSRLCECDLAVGRRQCDAFDEGACVCLCLPVSQCMAGLSQQAQRYLNCQNEHKLSCLRMTLYVL